MVEPHEYPNIVDAIISGIILLLHMYYMMKSASRPKKDPEHVFAFPLYLLVVVLSAVSIITSCLLLLGQGTYVRSDGEVAPYARWTQIGIVVLLLDYVMSACYFWGGGFRDVFVGFASLVSAVSGVCATLSTGLNMYFWFITALVANVMVLVASINPYGPHSDSIRFWFIPLGTFLIKTVLWVAYLLSPAGEGIFGDITTEWIYFVFIYILIGTGASASHTASSVFGDVEITEITMERKMKKNSSSSRKKSKYTTN